MKIASKSAVPFFARFRNQLLGLVLVAFVPVVILTIHSNIKERKRQKHSTRLETVATVKLAAAKQEAYVKGARKLLTTISQFRFLVATTNRNFSQVHFTNLRALSPEYLDMGLIEADGTLCSSTILTNQSPNLSNWSCFQRTVAEKRFSIGDFVRNGTTQKDTLDFGFPIFDEKGALQRVLFASLDVSELRGAAREVDLPEGGNIRVVDKKGSLLAQHSTSNSDTPSGTSIAHHTGLMNALKEAGSVFESRDAEQIEKLFAVIGISDGFKNRVWVSVDVPTKAAFASADEALRRNILIIAIIAFLALVAAYFYADRFFLRPLNLLTAEAQLLAAGKWTHATQTLRGKGELAILSNNFREMALALEEQRHCLETANAQLEQRVRDRTIQLEQTSKELEAFSYSVSHDLRSPVRHIAGFVDLLKNELGSSVSSKGARFIEIIADSAKQMGTLIDELLVFSRMGRVEMQKSIINTDSLIQTALESLEPETKSRSIVWKRCPLPDLQADPSMLRQVFVNLLSNAIKYTQPRDPACIEIGHIEKETEIVVFVRDNGVGFDMQYGNKLFGVFQRLHHHDEFEGTGIGLANVRRIINRHGGRTWAEGKVGEGATFYFSLPKIK